MKENTGKGTDRWMYLGIVQRADQLRSVTEMLVAAMEDLSEQMENVEECLEVIGQGTDAVQDRMEELISMMENN